MVAGAQHWRRWKDDTKMFLLGYYKEKNVYKDLLGDWQRVLRNAQHGFTGAGMPGATAG